MKKIDSSYVDWGEYVDQTIGKRHPIAARVLKRAYLGYDPEDHTLVFSFWGIAKGLIEHIALLRVDAAKMIDDFSELVGMDIDFV